MKTAETKTIAITIPTYRREKELKRLLASIATQEEVPDGYRFELLIVNNTPISYVSAVLGDVPEIPFAVHSIDVTQRGLSNVRNSAVAWVLAHDMDALIFVDDDEVVPPGWLAAMVGAWERYGADILTGPVAQLLPPSVPRWVRKFGLLNTHLKIASGTRLQTANSNNTLVSRAVLERMGPCFHPAMNRSGGEDTLYFHQCQMKGFSVYWDNSILIGEPTPPDRTTAAYVLKRWFHYGMNYIRIYRILFPTTWRNQSIELMKRGIVGITRGFVASLIKRDSGRLGHSVCRLSALAGVIVNFAGISATSTIYHSSSTNP